MNQIQEQLLHLIRAALAGRGTALPQEAELAKLHEIASRHGVLALFYYGAAACGVPTVAFRFGDAAEEEILHGKTGFIIPQGDEKSFVDALVRLFEEKELVASYSKEAREHAKKFHIDCIAKDWVALLDALPLDKNCKS